MHTSVILATWDAEVEGLFEPSSSHSAFQPRWQSEIQSWTKTKQSNTFANLHVYSCNFTVISSYTSFEGKYEVGWWLEWLMAFLVVLGPLLRIIYQNSVSMYFFFYMINWNIWLLAMCWVYHSKYNIKWAATNSVSGMYNQMHSYYI